LFNYEEQEGSQKKTTFTTVTKVISLATIPLIGLAVIGSIVFLFLFPLFWQSSCSRPVKSFEEVTYRVHVPIEVQNVGLYIGLLNTTLRMNQRVYVANGKIVCVGPMTETCNNMAENRRQIDGRGLVLTPGLVDMHSHLGVYSMPGDLQALQDGNEMTDPTTPFVRAIDAFRTTDPAIAESLKLGGITTSVILPGSGNTIGGEGLAIKHQIDKVSIEDYRIKAMPKLLKFACGENPKRVYGSRGQMPMSRMGNAWVMRRKLQQAKDLLLKQKQFDCSKMASSNPEMRPGNLELDALVSLLQGDAVLHHHCYEVVDLEMAIRLSHEFGYKIAAFHHALEAWKIADILKENNIAAALFADMYGFKVEGYQGSVHAPTILHESGVRLVLKSDHPVTMSKNLITEARRAFYYGMSDVAAIAAVTSNPAFVTGLGWRLGSIEVGKDADFVLWNGNPLINGVTPMTVVVEGNILYNLLGGSPQLQFPQVVSKPDQNLVVTEGNVSGSYVITNVGIPTENQEQSNTIVVTNGQISCIGASCNIPIGFTKYSLEGGRQIPGIVLPGLIDTGTSIGMQEISSEGNTGDGVVFGDMATAIIAADGATLQGKPIDASMKGGVTIAVARPQGFGLITGRSSAFYIINSFVTDSPWYNSSIALNGNIGNSAKGSGVTRTISGQISQLRSTFVAGTDPYIRQVLDRTMPFVVNVHKAEQINMLLQLQSQFGFRLIILGGTEAWMLAGKLAFQNISVILAPIIDGGILWETRRTDSVYGLKILLDSGVEVAVTMGNLLDIRNLRWVAGKIGLESGFTPERIYTLMTRNPANMFELDKGAGRVITGTMANFVLYTGNDNPLQFTSQIKLVAVGSNVDRNPRQF